MSDAWNAIGSCGRRSRTSAGAQSHADTIIEIHSVRFGRRTFSSTIEVEHAGIDVTSHVLLYGDRNSALAAANLSLATPLPSASARRT